MSKYSLKKIEWFHKIAVRPQIWNRVNITKNGKSVDIKFKNIPIKYKILKHKLNTEKVTCSYEFHNLTSFSIDLLENATL